MQAGCLHHKEAGGNVGLFTYKNEKKKVYRISIPYIMHE